MRTTRSYERVMKLKIFTVARAVVRSPMALYGWDDMGDKDVINRFISNNDGMMESEVNEVLKALRREKLIVKRVEDSTTPDRKLRRYTLTKKGPDWVHEVNDAIIHTMIH